MQRSQMLAQTVDDSIESFVRNRLAFITTTLESEHMRSFPFKLIQERAHQCRLAHTRVAVNVNRHRLAIAGGGKGLVQLHDLASAPDELGISGTGRKRPGQSRGDGGS